VGDPGWQSQAALVAGFFEDALGRQASGIVVHGSAALGGWTPTSDLDMLVTSKRTDGDWLAIGGQLLAALAPAPVVEVSVVSAAAGASPRPPWPFLLHVNQADRRVVVDRGKGDADLLMHYLVARSSGIAISGPPPGAAFGAVQRASVLQYLCEELAWALEEADQRYAVLNACRALAYCEDGAVLSKIDGGAWALERNLGSTLVSPALAAQAKGLDLGRSTLEAQAFVEHCTAVIRAQISS
jgi:predicted nucleotidyltransferase